MKLVHIADPHLGAAPDTGHPWSKARADALWQTFAKVLARTEEEQADLLLIAGDLFHRQPLLRELKEVNALFSRLTHTKVVMIAGNHDCITDRSNYRQFTWCPQVIFFQDMQLQKIRFPELHTTVYGRSYHSKEDKEPLYTPIPLEPAEDIHILLAHGGDAAHRPYNRNQLAQAGFHYVALGHIHKPDMNFSDGIVNPGSLEPIEPNDYGSHGFVIAEITREQTKVRWVPFASAEYIPMEFRVQPATTSMILMETILKAIRQKGENNIYKIRLTGRKDPDIQFGHDFSGGVPAALSAPHLKILDFQDLTEPDYDFARLARDHADDLIGAYIKTLTSDEMMRPYTDASQKGAAASQQQEQQIRSKALYYGVKALLDTAQRK